MVGVALAVINVSTQIQCLVENSHLIIKEGTSKKWLDGFWDPCPGTPKQLYVRYMFWNAMHECMVDDEEQLMIPVEGMCLGVLVS